jgi:hypothetical protein
LRPTSALIPALLVSLSSGSIGAARLDALRSVGGLPPHIVGMFEEPASFQQSRTGLYYVFDRRAHAVWTIDPAKTIARKAVDIGGEPGRILEPYGFAVAADGTFVVADVPRRQERVQTFDATGGFRTGFFLPARPVVRVAVGSAVLSGIGAIQHTGRSVLLSYPETGSLFTEYSLSGTMTRSFGTLRVTGHEQEPDVHMAMNEGFPLVDPTGGYYFVFITGQPAFRKYDAAGALLFERHVEGREIDAVIASQPTQWPRRIVEEHEMPFVAPIIRAAAVDPGGRLWVAMAVPFTYVYDGDGDKVRTVQFNAAGIVNPTSLSFTPAGHLLVTPGCYEFDPAASP